MKTTGSMETDIGNEWAASSYGARCRSCDREIRDSEREVLILKNTTLETARFHAGGICVADLMGWSVAEDMFILINPVYGRVRA